MSFGSFYADIEPAISHTGVIPDAGNARDPQSITTNGLFLESRSIISFLI